MSGADFLMGENVYRAGHHSDCLSTIEDKFINGDFPFFTLHANLTSCATSCFFGKDWYRQRA